MTAIAPRVGLVPAAPADVVGIHVAGADVAGADVADCWREYGAHPDDVAALCAYAASTFGERLDAPLPLADEPCVATWEAYARESVADGAAVVLRRHLPQLRFAITPDVANDPVYQSVVRRGIWPSEDTWPGFADPSGITLHITATAAGSLPVVVARDRGDFERLVQALTKRNAPVPIPISSGACMVSGYVNWGRVHAARRAWAAARGGDDANAWLAEFALLRADPARWQDRFMLLSAGPYAAVPSSDLGLPDDEWRQHSVVLRREHEAAHYVTKRLYGVMHNALHDELLADYAGIVAAAGRYRPDWGMRVLGVDARGQLLPEARLLNYRGATPLNDRAMRALARLAVRAIETIGQLDAWLRDAVRDAHPLAARTAALLAIAETPLDALSRRESLPSMQQRCHRGLAAFVPTPAVSVPARA